MSLSSLARSFHRALFHNPESNKQWKALQTFMEQYLGPICIDVPVEGGDVRAFFRTQTLVGNDHNTTWNRRSDGERSLAMREPIGTGYDAAQAVCHLWEQMTTLRPHETILTYQRTINCADIHAHYSTFRFRDGTFENLGANVLDIPPDRPWFITEYLLYQAAEREVFDGVKDAAPATP